MVRMSLPLSETIETFERVSNEGDTEVSADLGSGIIKAAWNGIDHALINIVKHQRAKVQQLGGTLFIEKAPAVVKRQLDAWGEVGASEQLMKSVKRKFDPRGILNPGRFVAGI